MARPVRLVLILVLALVAALGIPVAAEEGGCVDPETGELVLAEQQVYLHQAETKAGNLAAFDVGSFPTWNEEAPATSVQGGAGGGYLANAASYLEPTVAEQTGLTVEGTFDGCLDTMLLDLYAFLPTNRTSISGDLEERAFSGMVTLTLDGQTVMSAMEIEMNTVPNPDGDATYLIRVAITDVHRAMAGWGIDPAGDHTIRLTVAPRFVNTDNALFVYDTTEVPAGILFNGAPDEDYPQLPAW